jgi:hypothetical protein
MKVVWLDNARLSMFQMVFPFKLGWKTRVETSDL